MKHLVLIILVCIAAIVLLFGALFLIGSWFLPHISSTVTSTEGASAPAASAGAHAPYFDLPDISGTHLRLTDTFGTPTIVTFWSSEDEGAADQLKILDDYQAHHGTSTVALIAIDSQEDATVVHSFLRRGGYQVPVVLDTRGAVSELYGIKALPTTFFIDRDGVVVAVRTGVLSESDLVNNSEAILR